MFDVLANILLWFVIIIVAVTMKYSLYDILLHTEAFIEE